MKGEFYLSAIKHDNFNPRIIEWLSSYTRVKGTSANNYRELFTQILDNPAEIWRHAFESQISEASRNVILSLYSLGGNEDLQVLEQIWSHHHRCMAVKYNFRMTPNEFTRALKELDGAFLRYSNGKAEFLNPSIKDFYPHCYQANQSLPLTSWRLPSALRKLHGCGTWRRRRTQRDCRQLCSQRRRP